MKFNLILVSTLVLLLMPLSLFAASPLLVDCQGGAPIQGSSERECAFSDVMREIKQLMNFAFAASVPITIISIAYAGIKILTAQENAGKINEAKKMIQMTLIGFLFILTAWLIVYTITSTFLKSEFYTPFLGSKSSTSSVNTGN